MNWDQLEGQWAQVKGKVREKWGLLTDNDLQVIAGRKDRLLGRLQELYGDKKDSATKDADAFIKGL